MTSARWLAMALLGIVACRSARDPEPTRAPPMPVVKLDAHRGATALFGGNPLLLSFERDWDKPGPLRLSRGPGPVERTLEGWPIDVAGNAAYVLEPAGSEARVLRLGLTGEPEQLARIPTAPTPYRTLGAITGNGYVALVTPSSGKGATLRIIAPDKTVREVKAVRDTDEISALAANPKGSEIALITSYSHGRLPPGAPQAAITLFDAATGTPRWSVTFPSHLWATEGEAGFIDGKLAVHFRDGLVGYDLATGASTQLIASEGLNARSMTFAPSGDALAYVHWVHPSDMAPLTTREACVVYVVRAAEPAPTDPVIEFKARCYFGTGILFVDHALWVAPQ